LTGPISLGVGGTVASVTTAVVPARTSQKAPGRSTAPGLAAVLTALRSLRRPGGIEPAGPFRPHHSDRRAPPQAVVARAGRARFDRRNPSAGASRSGSLPSVAPLPAGTLTFERLLRPPVTPVPTATRCPPPGVMSGRRGVGWYLISRGRAYAETYLILSKTNMSDKQNTYIHGARGMYQRMAPTSGGHAMKSPPIERGVGPFSYGRYDP
jgi:hypothetical protein